MDSTRLLVFFSSLICLASVINAQDLDTLIDSVFNVKNDTVNKNPEVNLQPSGGGGGNGGGSGGEQAGCTCVAYYLCNNGTINKDGTGIIDIRYVTKQKNEHTVYFNINFITAFKILHHDILSSNGR